MGDKAPSPKSIPPYMRFVLGGSSGMLATCIVQPMDLIKTRMQLMGPAGKDMTAIKMGREVIRKNGFTGLYAGLSAALFRQATYTTGRLGCFNYITDLYTAAYGTPNFGAKLVTGITAGAIGAFVGNPAEVALIRMTADGRLPPEQRRNYTNVFNALGRYVIDRDAPKLILPCVTVYVDVLTGIMTIYQFARWQSHGSALIYMTADGRLPPEARTNYTNVLNALGGQAREMLLPSLGDGIFLHFSASMISGLVTTAASQPLDMIKTRLQNAAKGGGQAGIVGTFFDVVKKEGFFGLWNGFLPTYFKIGPHTVFTFIFLEQLTALYKTI